MTLTRADRAFSFSGISTLQWARHVVQILVFVFLNAKLFGLKSTGIIVPFLWSSGAPYSTALAAFDSLEYTIAKATFPILVLGVIYLTAITVGKVMCGWACPFGLVQDILSYLPLKKQKFSPLTHSQLKDVKWVVLGVSLLVAALCGFRRSINPNSNPAGVFSDSPFSVVSPAATLFAYLPWMLIWPEAPVLHSGYIPWLKLAVFACLIAPCFFVPRFFCRYLCPMGAMLEPLSKYKMLQIKRTPGNKDELNKILADVCPTGVQIESDASRAIDHPACVHCGKCLTEAPKMLQQSFSLSAS